MKKDKMKTTRVPTFVCPTCGEELDAASNGAGATPHAGAVSVCIKCAEITVFNEDLTQRLPTAGELAEIKANPSWGEIQALQIAIRMRELKDGNESAAV